MKMTIVQLSQPVLSSVRAVQAVSGNGVAIAFPEPSEIEFRLSEVIDVDLDQLGLNQRIVNLTTGKAFTLNIAKSDVHDMRLPGGHGSNRFPDPERLRGG